MLQPESDLGADKISDAFACDSQSSGAYIFRPNTSNVWPAQCVSDTPSASQDCSNLPTFEVVVGALVNEVHVTFNDWATIVVRLTANMPFIEVEYTVGPIPQYSFEQGGEKYLQGKEVVLRYNTSLNTLGSFYADSNAREMVKREYNLRGPSYPLPYQISEPVAGNYYPINVLGALQDDAAGIGFSVAVDRSMV